MNFVRSVIAIILISLFIGCSTSDDDQKNSRNLVGTWELRYEVEYDSNGEIWEEETYKAGSAESILEIDEKFITGREEGTLFNGQAMAYTYDPEDQVLIYFGFKIDVEWLDSNKVNFTVENTEGKSITTWVRI